MKQTWRENMEPQAVIAWNEVTQRIDDESIFAMVATIFLRDGRERMESLSRALQDNDGESVRFLAHAIKGSAATLAAHRLASAAKDLERAATSHAGDAWAGLYAVLRDEYDRVRALLSGTGWRDAYQRHGRSPMSH